MPRSQLSRPRKPQRERRDVGSVSVSGYPIRFGYVHAGLCLQTVDRGEGDRRRAVDPQLYPRDRARERDRSRSEEHTSELQSLMRISYAVFCLKTKKRQSKTLDTNA